MKNTMKTYHKLPFWIISILFAVFINISLHAQYVTTLAGSGSAGFANGQGTSASFYSPSGVAVDSSGNVYVADRNNNRIRKITPSGNVTTLAGGGGGGWNGSGSANGAGTSASFYSPNGVAVDVGGNVYVADQTNQRIRKISPSGSVTTLAGSGSQGSANGVGTSATFTNPEDVAVDGSGNVYVADTYNHLIRKITPSGNVTTLAGSGSEAYADGQGTLASFWFPQGVAVDGSGNVYVADTRNNRIRKITPSGYVTTLAGSGNEAFADGQGTSASFISPTSVALDGSGNVYVASEDHRIRKITPSGSVTTLAGAGSQGSADGVGTSATFNFPSGVAVDGSGNVYVADKDNHRIRKIMPSPQLTIEQPAGTPLTNYQSFSLGAAVVGSTKTLTFTIKNTGTAPLTGLYINNYGWDIQASLLASDTLAPGESMTFTVT